MSREQLVEDFFNAWRAMDPDRIADFFTDDAVYDNIPMDSVQGKDKIRTTIAGWLAAMPGIDFRFLHVVVSGDVVLMERRDVISTEHGSRELPVMGVIEFEGDKIRAWREYFDLEQMKHLGDSE
jgi:limonene-1,2-epoxide hydrolase